jgi:hypothetical protein
MMKMVISVSESTSKFLCLTPFLFGILFGIGVMVQFIPVVKASKKAENWCETSGKITRAGIKSKFHTGSKQTHIIYDPDIVYEYDVDGSLYYGSRLAFDQAKTQAKVGLYQAGDSVTVFYDPDAPENAILERDLPPNTDLKLIFTLLLILGNIFLYAVGLEYLLHWS